MTTGGQMSLPLIGERDRAGNGTRTRDINLGKVALYQLSYSRKRCENIPKTVSEGKNINFNTRAVSA